MSAQTLIEALESDEAFTKWWLYDVPGGAEPACSFMRASILALIEKEKAGIESRIRNISEEEYRHIKSREDQERLDKFVCAALQSGFHGDVAVIEARIALKALGEG